MRIWKFFSGLLFRPRADPNQIPSRYPFAGALDIEYSDALGRRSECYIEAESLEARRGRLYVWGYCEQRQAIRQFRVDRIKALTDGETGEVIPPAAIAGWLARRAGMR